MAVPLILYVALSLPSVQGSIARTAEKELTGLLGTEVSVGSVSIAPFNRVVLSDVGVKDPRGETALQIGHLGAGIKLFEGLWNRRIVITYVEIIDLDLNLYRQSRQTPLNIQPIIDRFKKDEDNGSSKFDLAVNLLVIRRSGLTYDVRDAAPADSGRFDPAHIRVDGLRADLCAPRISDSRIEVEIKRMAAAEKSGLALKELRADVLADMESLTIENLAVELNNSRLALNDLTLQSPLGGGFDLKNALRSPVETLSETYLTLSDLSPFVRGLEDIDVRVDVEIETSGRADSISLEHFDLYIPESQARLSAHGLIKGLLHAKDSLSVDLRRLNVRTSVPKALDYLSKPASPLNHLYRKLSALAPLGDINLLGDLSLTPESIDFNGALDTDCGNIDIDCGIFKNRTGGPLELDGVISSMAFMPSELHKSLAPLSNIAFDAKADLVISGSRNIKGIAELSVPELTWNGTDFADINANADFRGNSVDATVRSSSPALDFSVSGGAELSGTMPLTELYAQVNNISLDPFVKGGRLKGDLSFEFDGSVRGRNPDVINGWIKVSDFRFSGRNDKSLSIPRLELDAHTGDSARSIMLRSPQVDADLSGHFSLRNIANDVKSLIAKVYPALLPADSCREISEFHYDLDLRIKEDSTISKFLGLPADIIYPVSVRSFGRGGETASVGLDIDAPYLRNKDKLIEGTRLSVMLDAISKHSDVTAHTSFPTKNGMLDLRIGSEGSVDSLGTSILWKIDREEDYHGNFDFATLFSRSEDSKDLLTDISVATSQMVFNDSSWTVNPALVHVMPGRISVEGLGGHRAGQSLNIHGVASADSIDRLIVDLDAIDIDYIFDSLNMSDAVQFGGRATGSFYGMKLLSGDPVLYTPRLKVEGLKYNGCVMGDGDIRSYWDNGNKAVRIMAEIVGGGGSKSEVDGVIKPMSSELDFTFKADRAPVGFMEPFMAAFTSKVTGEVSGEARLYGTFKDLDLYGDIYAKDLSLKLDFTNTTYTTTDSVHLRPGMISFDNVRLTDCNGKTAKLNGYVAHKYFHDPTFRFDITDARDFLVYDINENQTEDPWFGLIYGNGKASVSGVPGRVDINVAMSTAEQSTFSFVMSDAEQAIDYQFITLRDKNKAYKDSIAALDPTPLIVRQLRERIRRQEEQTSSDYAMTFDVGINPSVAVNLIMDPVGGDKITAYGSGQLRMSYNSSDGDLRMYGDYKINHGTYNFTLQDLIIKEFKIREGSKITFLGDPYSALLDITASYSVNANLSDLDESFLEDRELNRTSVPVDALMMVRGDIRQPEITFDLNFPTLTRDTYRKVRSIVSTEDMMNRQIIYLLALNKFYTPDYMTATHGNELVSVASSTISSRLSSMLGQLSDNWSIAPAIRSDRGDFSDVEVEVALSSHLLNNRLLLNGNFGYRDNSMNNNSFIGDFDIRYLLNRAGTIQLKAYNRYNDQNYYLKSALTTQGVGIVFKRDFDNIFSFLKPKKKAKKKDREDDQSDSPAPADAAKKEESDSEKSGE